MTKDERNQRVIGLKKNGLSYKEISVKLDIPIGTVKSILSRKNEMSYSCKNCDKPISSIKGKKAKVFCSDACRLLWWNNHRDIGNKNIYFKVCPNCSEKFETVYSAKKYCSHECYIANRYDKVGGDNES